MVFCIVFVISLVVVVVTVEPLIVLRVPSAITFTEFIVCVKFGAQIFKQTQMLYVLYWLIFQVTPSEDLCVVSSLRTAGWIRVISGPLKNSVLEVMGVCDRHIVSMAHSEKARNDLSLPMTLNDV